MLRILDLNISRVNTGLGLIAMIGISKISFLMQSLLLEKKYRCVFLNGNWFFENDNGSYKLFSYRPKSVHPIYINSNKKSIITYCFKGHKFRQTFFLCKTSSFFELYPSKTIANSRYTQDAQLTGLILFFLKCDFFPKPCFNLLIRDDSLLHSYSTFKNPDKENEKAFLDTIFNARSVKTKEIYFLFSFIVPEIKYMWFNFRKHNLLEAKKNLSNINKLMKKSYKMNYNVKQYLTLKIKIKILICKIWIGGFKNE